MKAVVTTRQAGQAIEVTVTQPFDPKVYDVPLTARTTVPAQWTSAQVTQGRDSKKVPVQKDSGGSYVQYRVTPNAGVVRLDKAQ